MRSSTPDAPPGRVSADQVAADAPTAGNARLDDLAQLTAEVVTAILGCLPF